MEKQLWQDNSAINAGWQAQRLLKIAQMEYSRPLKGQKALVFGGGIKAEELHNALSPRFGCVRLAASADLLQENDDKFELAIILEPISHKVLDGLMAEGGLAIDANLQRSGEWIMHDKSLGYKRIRVLSLNG